MIIYIADFNLPNNSAYSHQVLKMCDAFCLRDKKIKLYVKNKNKNLKFEKLKREYLLKNKFEIFSILNQKNKNFLYNLLFSIIVSFKVKRETDKFKLVLTRVFLVSVFLSLFKIKHILEIHQECRGLTKIILNTFYLIYGLKYIKIVYINKNLKKYFKIFKKSKSSVLDDAVDCNDFIVNPKSITNSCVYTGSLSPGKGFELILSLSKKLKNVKFYVYGERRLLDSKWSECKIPSNVIMKNFVSYKKIPFILKSHKILLMPYLRKSYGRLNNLNLSEYMSPLKLFDYLAAGRVIFATDLKVYNHILKNKLNCFKFSDLDLKMWVYQIKRVLKNYSKYKKIRNNALKTSLKFTWENRAYKILKLNDQK